MGPLFYVETQRKPPLQPRSCWGLRGRRVRGAMTTNTATTAEPTWLAAAKVARRPPCLKDVQAEHKGKCYLPISKDREGKPAQSIEP